MEMFNYFMEYVNRKDPEMKELVMPLVEGYIKSRKDINNTDFMPTGFDTQGYSIYPEQEIMEQFLDEQDMQAIITLSAEALAKEEEMEQEEHDVQNEAQHDPCATSPSTCATAKAEGGTRSERAGLPAEASAKEGLRPLRPAMSDERKRELMAWAEKVIEKNKHLLSQTGQTDTNKDQPQNDNPGKEQAVAA